MREERFLKNYSKAAIVFALILLITIFTPFAIPVYRGVVSKEALSYVWIWGLCYGQGQFFFLIMPFGLAFFLILFAILILMSSFELNKNKINFGKFGEQMFIYSFLIILVSVILRAIIEYSFLFFSDVPLVYGSTRADFWTYHSPGFGYFGIFITSYLLLNASLASIGYSKSNFLGYAIVLFIILTFTMISLSLFTWISPF